MAIDFPLKRIADMPLLMAVVFSCIVVAAICALRAAGFLQLPELTAYDLLLAATSKQEPGRTPPIVLIGITEDEIQSLGRWPLTDEMLTNMLELVQSHHPRVVGVDIYRDQAVPPGRGLLNALLSSTDNVVLIYKVGDEIAATINPPDVLKGTGRVGFSDMVVDPDGTVRRGLLFMDNGQQVFYSLPLVLALKYLQKEGIFPREGAPDPTHIRLGDVTIPPFESNDGAYIAADAGGYQFILNFRGNRAPFTQLSLTELTEADTVGELIRDSVVIIGVTAESVKDTFITPFSHAMNAGEAMSGIALNGHIIDQLIRMAINGEQPVQVLADRWEHLLIAVWGILGALVAVYIKVLWQFLLVIAGGLTAIVMLPYMAFTNGWWLPLVPPAMAWLLSASTVMVFLRSRERSQRKLLMDLFSRNVSADVAEEIWRQRDQFLEGGRLAASEVTATVLFSDLENFTALSERLGPTRLMDWLNRYMEIMAGLVIRHGGIVDDYYGDAIMADFGVPLARDTDDAIVQDARHAVDCALAMRTEINQLNEECKQQGFPTMRMRVGICTGEMVAGFLGNKERMKYTTIGDTINTAARLESYGKELPPMDALEGSCRILVGERTARCLGAGYRIEPVGNLELRGKVKLVPVFKVMARNSHLKD